MYMYTHIMEYSRRPQTELLCNENIPGMQVMSSNYWYLFSKARLDRIHSTSADRHPHLWAEMLLVWMSRPQNLLGSFTDVLLFCCGICSHKERFQDLSCDSMSIKDRPQTLFSDLLKDHFLIRVYLKLWRRKGNLMTTQAFNIVNN